MADCSLTRLVLSTLTQCSAAEPGSLAIDTRAHGARGFRPALVLVERGPTPPLMASFGPVKATAPRVHAAVLLSRYRALLAALEDPKFSVSVNENSARVVPAQFR
jgi:hypothetical protein